MRAAVAQAMRILGRQYVLGRTLDEALRRGRSLAEAPVSGFSYDMLGEAARTYADAERYFQAYADAIDTLGIEVTSLSLLTRWNSSCPRVCAKGRYPSSSTVVAPTCSSS